MTARAAFPVFTVSRRRECAESAVNAGTVDLAAGPRAVVSLIVFITRDSTIPRQSGPEKRSHPVTRPTHR
jgi:hypothetical protein